MKQKSRKKGNLSELGGEVLRNALEAAAIEKPWHIIGDGKPPKKPPSNYKYTDELVRLQFELLKMQEWVRLEGLKVVVLFEGRDAAGKGGVIKRITASLNPRICRVVALGTPTEKERGQWYFQRDVEHLPARGEMVLFDRSWYNRAGVERVMGFCSDEEYHEFLRACPLFEEMLVRAGIHVIKYWFSVNDEEQEKRFSERMHNPIKRWKLSPMDLESFRRWYDYSRARDLMLEATDKEDAPWHILHSDDKRRARLNGIKHILSLIPYEKVKHDKVKLPKRSKHGKYDDAASLRGRNLIPERY